MPGKILLSTAYFPPAEYFSLIKNADEILIESEENYIKQTYRNRCSILTANGIQVLSVPAMKSSSLKTPVRDMLIDYSKRWQQVHKRAMRSSYNRSPYYLFYYEDFEKILNRNFRFLIDLNNEMLQKCLEIVGIDKCTSYTSSYEPVNSTDYDFRYTISPKVESKYVSKPYYQVFNVNGFVPGLSILDLIFNMGPESTDYI